jgi:hypothetical protein
MTLKNLRDIKCEVQILGQSYYLISTPDMDAAHPFAGDGRAIFTAETGQNRPGLI